MQCFVNVPTVSRVRVWKGYPKFILFIVITEFSLGVDLVAKDLGDGDGWRLCLGDLLLFLVVLFLLLLDSYIAIHAKKEASD